MLKLYELTCLLSPDFSDEQALAFTQGIEAKLEKDKIIKSEIPKKIGLSYLIKKQTTAFLFSIIFKTEPQKADELKKTLEGEEKILRFLLLSKKQIPESQIFTTTKKLREPILSLDQSETAPTPVEPVKNKEKEKIKDNEKEKIEKKTTRKKKTGGEEIKAELKQIEEDLDKILGVPDDE